MIVQFAFLCPLGLIAKLYRIEPIVVLASTENSSFSGIFIDHHVVMQCVCYTQIYTDTLGLKGTMLPAAHARVDENHFEIVSPTFSNTVGEFRKLFSSV